MENRNLSERNYSRQPHVLVNAKYALSMNEIDIILTLLTEVYKEDKDFKDYSFTLLDFNKKTNKTLTSRDLNSCIKSLMSKPLELKVLNQNWIIVNWFSYFEYNKGLITCRFDKRLKPFLLDIKERFVISDLRHILAMRSSYAKRIYLLLKEYSKIGKRTFEVAELQTILQVPKSLKTYSNFKMKVLLRAKKDIDKFSDIKIELQEIKQLRKVVKITFVIKKNDTDLKTFIQIIRELYPNQDLYKYNERMTRCSDKGLLYWVSTLEHLSKENAKKAWEHLHENRKDLEFIKENRRALEETLRRLEG
jgi:plasmid replication initiation protein